jgi:hypothetical protein
VDLTALPTEQHRRELLDLDLRPTVRQGAPDGRIRAALEA